MGNIENIHGVTCLGLANIWLYGKLAVVDRHQYGCRSIAVKDVHSLKHLLNLILGPNIIVVVPCIYQTRVDLELKACDDAKIVPSTRHAPK